MAYLTFLLPAHYQHTHPCMLQAYPCWLPLLSRARCLAGCGPDHAMGPVGEWRVVGEAKEREQHIMLYN